jgi:hypothetical protein
MAKLESLAVPSFIMTVQLPSRSLHEFRWDETKTLQVTSHSKPREPWKSLNNNLKKNGWHILGSVCRDHFGIIRQSLERDLIFIHRTYIYTFRLFHTFNPWKEEIYFQEKIFHLFVGVPQVNLGNVPLFYLLNLRFWSPMGSMTESRFYAFATSFISTLTAPIWINGLLQNHWSFKKTLECCLFSGSLLQSSSVTNSTSALCPPLLLISQESFLSMY